MIGKTIGKYRFVDKLGRGGMGTVYRAVDETLDREVAIKVLHPDLADDDIMKRFRAEATTLARLNHPEIATIYEVARADAELLMVMELVRGETLDELSQRAGPMPPEQAALIVAQVLGALEHAHRAGIVHRDLKPANVMVTERGGVKIMDFGIARVAGAEHLTSDGHMMGTPAYMAPEQVMAKDVDARADVYACGVVFYRLLTGNLPFEADTAIGMVQKQLSEAPAPLNTHRADLPDWCSRVLDRALAKSPEDRYQSAAEFQQALLAEVGATEQSGASTAARLIAQTPLPARAPTPVATTARPIPPAVVETAPPTIVLKKNHFAAASALLAVVAAGVVVLAVFAFRRTSPPATSDGPSATSATGPGPSQTAAPSSSTASAGQAVPAASSDRTLTTTQSGAVAGTSVASAPPSSVAPVVSAARGAAETPAPAANVAASVAAAPPKSSASLASYAFEAKTVVVDNGKNRERDAKIMLADGKMTISDRDDQPLASVPLDSVLGIYISNAKQPMWMSPSGPAEAMKVEGGALGFLKGGRNWLVLHTKAATLVFRIEDDQMKGALKAVEDHTGRKVERIGKDD